MNLSPTMIRFFRLPAAWIAGYGALVLFAPPLLAAVVVKHDAGILGISNKALKELKFLEGGAGAHPNRVVSEIPVDAHNCLMITDKLDGRRQTMVVGGLHYRDFLRTLVTHPRRKGWFVALMEDPLGKRVEPGTSFDAADTLYLDVSTLENNLRL